MFAGRGTFLVHTYKYKCYVHDTKPSQYACLLMIWVGLDSFGCSVTARHRTEVYLKLPVLK
jgi:hypothetical protein